MISPNDLSLLLHALILFVVALTSLATYLINRKIASLNGDVKSAHEEIKKLKSGKQDKPSA
jgi:hypothetical protein